GGLRGGAANGGGLGGGPRGGLGGQLHGGGLALRQVVHLLRQRDEGLEDALALRGLLRAEVLQIDDVLVEPLNLALQVLRVDDRRAQPARRRRVGLPGRGLLRGGSGSGGRFRRGSGRR